VGGALEPRATGRSRRRHQRPEGDAHRTRRSAGFDRAARLRRHQEMAHLLRLRRHGARHAEHHERSGDRRCDPRDRARGSDCPDPRRATLLRRGGARSRDGRAVGLRCEGDGDRQRGRRTTLSGDFECSDLRRHRQRDRARDRCRHAGQHGSGAVPSDHHLSRRHPGHRRLPRRRRVAEGCRWSSVHARLRTGKEGARFARRRLAAHGGAHRQRQGCQDPLRGSSVARHHAARRASHQAQPARGVGDLPLLSRYRPGEGLDPRATRAALHDGRRAHRSHRPKSNAEGIVRGRRSGVLGHAWLQPAIRSRRPWWPE
jgi:hypothetical protein